MLSVMTDASGKNRRLCAIAMLLVFPLCNLGLTACKKDNEKSGAGDHASLASVVSAPAEINALEAEASLPSGEMKGLSVHTIPTPAESPVIPLPEMKPVAGTDIFVRMSQRMVQNPGWTQRFPELYKPLLDCLEQVEGGAAYAAGVTEESAQLLLVKIVGLDNHGHECRITKTGGQALSITPVETLDESGPAFYPRFAGKPLTNNPECYIMEPVVARPGGMIGWLAFKKDNCMISHVP